jgi:hypothetical protein
MVVPVQYLMYYVYFKYSDKAESLTLYLWSYVPVFNVNFKARCIQGCDGVKIQTFDTVFTTVSLWPPICALIARGQVWPSLHTGSSWANISRPFTSASDSSILNICDHRAGSFDRAIEDNVIHNRHHNAHHSDVNTTAYQEGKLSELLD